MMNHATFSQRLGVAPTTPIEITVRDDAPENLRVFTLDKLREIGIPPSKMRDVVCRILHSRPDLNNWSEYPNIWEEVQRRVFEAVWYHFYDILEALCKELDGLRLSGFQETFNDFCITNGIGWRLEGSQLFSRGPEAFEETIRGAHQALQATGRSTANREINEALRALARRPEPDLTGAAFHAVAAMECVARDITGHSNSTFGDIVKKSPDLFEEPLKTAASKLWGYASENLRHIRENTEPSREKVELVVSLAAVLTTHLVRKA